ncbi:MAG TPA: hypothetical protein PLY80_17970, partial [Pseudomonadota bacterium]|nr:hypothetical protein [Pseudomonadota bacterium]
MSKPPLSAASKPVLFALGAWVAMACPRFACALGESAPIDINKFHPAPGTQKLVTLDLAEVDPHLTFVPQLFVHYARRPLVYTLGGVPAADLVQNRLTGDISVSVSFLRRLQVSLSLPVTFWQTGELPQNGFLDPKDPTSGRTVKRQFAKDGLAQAGQEDLRFSVKAVLYRYRQNDDPEKIGFGLGIAGDLTVPTGNADSFMGSRLPTFAPRLLAHLDYRRLQVAAFVGSIFSSTERFYNAETQHSFLFGLGLQLQLRRSPTAPISLVTEAWGSTPFVVTDRLANTPAELTVALKAAYHGFTFFLGGGPGLSPG